MSFQNYISSNWGILIVLAALTIFLSMDKYLKHRMVRQIHLTDGLLLIFSMTSYIENHLGNISEYSVWRAITSAVNYSMTPLILISIAMIVYPGHRRQLYIPWAVNTFLCFLSIPTGIVFGFEKASNSFQRGPLGYLPFFINGLYLAYLMFRVFKHRRWENKEFVILGFMLLTAVACLLMPLIFTEESEHWLMLTIAFDMLVYYVFLLQQFTNRDPLTNLLNRQCYYADLGKLKDDLTALIAIDMDGLKTINDSQGHAEGDKALKAVARCFIKAVERRYHVYRIGGDEFTILCTDTDEKAVNILIAKIRLELEENNYSCSIGYAMNSGGMTPDQLYYRADEMLYENKREYYIASGKDRRRR